MNSISCDVVIESELTLLEGLDLKNLFHSSKHEPGPLYMFSCKIQFASLAFDPWSESIRFFFCFRMLGHMDFSELEIWSGWLQGMYKLFTVVNVLVRKLMKSHSTLISSSDWIFSIYIGRSSVHGKWIVIDADFFSEFCYLGICQS